MFSNFYCDCGGSGSCQSLQDRTPLQSSNLTRPANKKKQVLSVSVVPEISLSCIADELKAKRQHFLRADFTLNVYHRVRTKASQLQAFYANLSPDLSLQCSLRRRRSDRLDLRACWLKRRDQQLRSAKSSSRFPAGLAAVEKAFGDESRSKNIERRSLRNADTMSSNLTSSLLFYCVVQLQKSLSLATTKHPVFKAVEEMLELSHPNQLHLSEMDKVKNSVGGKVFFGV